MAMMMMMVIIIDTLIGSDILTLRRDMLVAEFFRSLLKGAVNIETMLL
jgi:hypothetical protein